MARTRRRAPAKPYTLGQWRGRQQWLCKRCGWETLGGEAAVLEHIAAAHPPKEPAAWAAAMKAAPVAENRGPQGQEG